MHKDDIFDDGDTVQPELDSRNDDGNLLHVPAPARGSMLPTSRLPTDEAVDLDVRSLRHQKKKGLSDFLRYDVVGDGLVRVGMTDPMPDIAVVTRGCSGSSVQDADDFSPTFLPYRGELGPNQYKRPVVDGPRYHGSRPASSMPLASKLSAPLPVLPDLSKDRQHVPPVLHSDRFYQQSNMAPSRRTGQQVALDEHGQMDLKDHGLPKVFSKRHEPVTQSNIVPHVHKGPVPSDRFYMHRELALGQAGPSNEVFRNQVRNDVEFDEDASGFVED